MSSSSQTTQKIPLHHRPDDTGYRLIELPPELESLLESENAPVLTLESSESSALLKTPDRTYSLRQKNTSNSVILLSPTADQGMAAISTIRETVELDVAPQTPVTSGGPLKNTGSRGKWHEMFGKGR
ncbi:sister chromatid cohesion protein dcc1 domain-containing protein [Trichoderma breve]|uniref:Sister chromatid cohesion protein dcc1 domain-containing protein n=1 Tax=Trichoderma breve TaxID=2034170 RepID=A0A9W9B7K4_9HYPO|nr:sister chromatid cohesion protein dcc1 domain-containing protein [Trichoderma breve]KAJ4854791.1 sister chromatid cohesion protein dcc1 domain-containing protein [Trichoderma breve]